MLRNGSYKRFALIGLCLVGLVSAGVYYLERGGTFAQMMHHGMGHHDNAHYRERYKGENRHHMGRHHGVDGTGHDMVTMPGLRGLDATAEESAELATMFRNFRDISRKVTKLPNGIRTVTFSAEEELMGVITSHVVGMITGPVDAPNASATERDSLRDVSQAIATRDIRRLLQRQRIVHDSAASASSDAQRAVVALVCGG